MTTIESTTLDLGMDTHQETISVACAEAGHAARPVTLGMIRTRLAEVDTVMRQLHSKASAHEFAYEAGTTSYGLHRHLAANGNRYVVSALF